MIPQMSPMNWLFLFIFFLLAFGLNAVKISFNSKLVISKNTPKASTKNMKFNI